MTYVKLSDGCSICTDDDIDSVVEYLVRQADINAPLCAFNSVGNGAVWVNPSQVTLVYEDGDE